MTWLIDTHLLLWAAIGSPRLPRRAREVLEDEGSRLLFSSASIWEVAIKSGQARRAGQAVPVGLDRPGFEVDVARLRRGLLENGYSELPITGEHAVLTYSIERL